MTLSTPSDIVRRTDILTTRYDLVKERLAEARGRETEARRRQTDVDAVQRTVQYIASRVQTEFGNYIGAIVTKALHHVFPTRSTDSFIVRFRENRGRTEVQLRLRTKDGDEAHPYDCSGGGVWDVLSFALRAAMLVVEQPAPSRTLFLDEPFKNLHGRHWRTRALNMLYNTFNLLGIQGFVVHQGEDGDDGLGEIGEREGSCVYEVSLTAPEHSRVEVYGANTGTR